MGKAQHQRRFVGGQAAAARDERRIAVELDAGRVDRRFGVRRADHRFILAGKRGLDRRGSRFQRRDAVLRRDRADARRRLLQVLDIEIVERDAAGRGMDEQRFAAADQHRLAERQHLGIARGLERDLRPNAGRIADGERDARLHSSLTPAVRITALQRSTSWRMNLAVSAGL